MHSLIEILQDGHFHSGEELGERLAISRAGVWKRLQRLETEMGLKVCAVKGRGYRLAQPLLLLDAERLNQAGLPWSVQVFDTLESTNSTAQRLAAAEPEKGLVVLAERQTAGRGRRGRQWVSPYGENLYLSLALPVTGGMRQLEGVSLVVGLAIVESLAGLGIAGLGLKWPNDVLVDQQKLAGILLELSGNPDDCGQLIIGIGLNINMNIGEAVDQPWTSLAKQLGKLCDRTSIAIDIIQHLAHYLSRFFAEGFTALRQDWERWHVWQGRVGCLSSGVNEVQGLILGIDSGGALKMRVDGQEQIFSGGELSLRLAHDT